MIRSNVKDVMARLEKARREAPAAVNAALRPDFYRSGMLYLAETAMNAVADTVEERAAVPVILNTFRAGKEGLKTIFSLNGMAAESLRHIDEAGIFEIPRQEVVEWVEQHKKITDRDRLKSGEQMPSEMIAERVVSAIERDPEPWLRMDEPGRGALNPTGLAMIVGLVGLPAGKVEQMLLAVLRIWSEYVRETAPQVIRHRIRKALS